MFAKIRSSMFIDALQFELTQFHGKLFKGVLKDDSGSVCSSIEKDVKNGADTFVWSGLNDLPYGRYTLTLSHGADEMNVNLVKRV